MARSHNPFAPKEASKLETPWGVFVVASPNKSRIAAASEVQKDAAALQDGDALELVADIAIRATSVGLENGDEFEAAARAAWDADAVTLEQLQGAAEFVSEELRGGAAEGND
jgi:uncharacterized Zn ribbon protein